ncbi:hypothetical protein QAD02_005125 [Eretmocerus hayati]|uniref:Uncharacterized protein n=1 Tax=Eretmocerus hayati TaxID=131215 RepID=A0ACC2NSR4_9HYME|nr:hypothetical protein QAD02_005125 [Eretmocerus hayati]
MRAYIYLSDLCYLGGRGVRRRKRSINGDPVSETEYSFVVALHDQNYQYFCAGSVVTSRVIMTASHCVSKNRLHYVRVLSADGITAFMHLVDTSYFYPPINDIYYNDIAVVILREPIQHATRINLPPRNYKMQMGTKVSSFGWGETGYERVSMYLRRVDLTVIARSRCTITDYGVISHQICTDSSINDICFGDSGGPLTYGDYNNYYQVGIASAVSKKGCRSGDPSIFTEVAPYYDWIMDYALRYP